MSTQATQTDKKKLLNDLTNLNKRINNCILYIITQINKDKDIEISSDKPSTISIKYNIIDYITGIYITMYREYNSKIYEISESYQLRSCFNDYIYLISTYYAYHIMIDAYNRYLSSSKSPITFNDYINDTYIETLKSKCANSEKKFYDDVIKHINLYYPSRLVNVKKILIINYFYNNLLFDIHNFTRISPSTTDINITVNYNDPKIQTRIINKPINQNFTDTLFKDNKKIKSIIADIYTKNKEIVKRYPLITSEQYITIPQYVGICWFISTISGMCYSELNRKLIISKIIYNFKNRYKITPSNDYIYNELNKQPGPDETDYNQEPYKSETLSSLYRKFVLFVYYIIINITNEKKKYNDFASNQELLIKILTQFKEFPEYFLNNIISLQQTTFVSEPSQSDEPSGGKRKAETSDCDGIDDNIKNLIEYIESYKNNLLYYKSDYHIIKKKCSDTIANLRESICKAKKIKMDHKPPPIISEQEPEPAQIYDDDKINEYKENEKILEKMEQDLITLEKKEKELDVFYIQQIAYSVPEEDTYIVANKRNGKIGAAKTSYNILSHFYSYLSISVLFLYLDNDDKKIYFPKDAPSLNNISDYDVIIISRLSLEIVPTKQDAFYNIETDKDCHGNIIFNDVADFIAKFQSSGTFALPENIILQNGNNFELDYILHSSIPELSQVNASHCISSFRYPNSSNYVSYNSLYTNELSDASIKISNILIDNDWYSEINTNSTYSINQQYINKINPKLMYYQISHQSEQDAIYYTYDKDIRYVYVKKNNLDNLNDDVNAIIQQVKTEEIMTVEGGNRNKSQKNNLMRHIKSNNFFSRLRI